MYQNQQVQNKPTSAYIISLIGGIIGLIISLLVMSLFGVLGSGAFGYSVGNVGLFSFWVILGVWMLITSILVIFFARRLNANPMEHSKYGAYIIIFSIIGLGGLLGLIGGILALVYKPIPSTPQQYGSTQGYPPQSYVAPPPPPPTMTQTCPRCKGQLTYVQQYNRWYCYTCQQYV